MYFKKVGHAQRNFKAVQNVFLPIHLPERAELEYRLRFLPVLKVLE